MMRVSSINWKYFVVAAEELNFTRAAKKLYISQQSLSNYIAKLESEVGIELFNRKNALTLTAAGESLYYNAKQILAIEELAQREIQDIRDFRTGSLRIGISARRGEKILPKVLPELKKKYPDLQIELVEKKLKDIRKDLIEGRIDLMFGYVEEKSDDIVYETYAQEEILVLMTKSIWDRYIPLTEQMKIVGMDQVPLEKFRNCPFILLGEGNWIQQKIKTYCTQKNISLKTEICTTSINTAVALAISGIGAAVCPEIYARKEYISGICREPVYRFTLADPIFRPKRAILYMKKRFLPKTARDFIEIVRKNA